MSRYLVTGASSGIGLAVARSLLDRGDEVLALSRTAGPLAGHQGFRHRAVDLADHGAVRDAAAELQGGSGLAGAVLSAGAGRFGGLEEFAPEQIVRLVELNLTSAMLLTAAILPGLKRAGGGSVVFIGSETALAGGRYGAVYAATKGGIASFARALRLETARSGLRVSVVNPGMVRSGFFDGLAFEPGPDPDNAVAVSAVAGAVCSVIDAPPGTVVDEINLSPQKTVVQRRVSKDA